MATEGDSRLAARSVIFKACEIKCKYFEETQEHVYRCTELKENKGTFEKIFSNANETKTLKQIIKEFLEN